MRFINISVEVILEYVLTLFLIRLLVWLIVFLIITVFSWLALRILVFYTSFLKKHVFKCKRYDYNKFSFKFKVLYYLGRINRFIFQMEEKVKPRFNISLYNLKNSSVFKWNLFNILLFSYIVTLNLNGGKLMKSVIVLKDSIITVVKLLFYHIGTHIDKVIIAIVPLSGIWFFCCIKQWMELEEIAQNDLVIKKKVIALYRLIDNNCDYLYQLENEVVINCKNNITDNIGYDFKNGKLIKLKMNMLKKENEIYIKSISSKINELIDCLKEQNSTKRIGVKNSYSSLLYHLNSEMNPFDSIYNLENSILNYKDYDSRYQDISEYFKNYHNQIYKKEFTKARVINKKPLEKLCAKKEDAVEYLEKFSEKSKLLIWKYLYIKEMYRCEVNKYFQKRYTFFEFNEYIKRYHFEKLINIMRFIY